MNTIHKVFGKIFLFAFVATFANGISAQTDKPAIKDIVEARQFIFHAQMALPTSGISRQLTSDYDLRVSKNKVVSSLPFFGRAYSMPYGSTDGGFNFTSEKFDYSSTNRKKGGWEISIKPKDVADFREFFLTISESGYGTLQVTTNNRQPISFTGFITPIK